MQNLLGLVVLIAALVGSYALMGPFAIVALIGGLIFFAIKGYMVTMEENKNKKYTKSDYKSVDEPDEEMLKRQERARKRLEELDLSAPITNRENVTVKSKLIDVVKKDDESNLGVFARVYNDLGHYADNVDWDEENPKRKMAYAYARRIAAAGLVLQGIWTKKEYDYNKNMLLSYQHTTGQSKGFQDEAGEQARELMRSYDSKITDVAIYNMISLMETNGIPLAHESGKLLSSDELIAQMNSVELSKSIETMRQLNNRLQ